ncbi:MAG: hypothetical protein KDE27_19825, partial [Planctomycetes bacterium]|nr:hypothetical protein [Planctomycetota bacterium]
MREPGDATEPPVGPAPEATEHRPQTPAGPTIAQDRFASLVSLVQSRAAAGRIPEARAELARLERAELLPPQRARV